MALLFLEGFEGFGTTTGDSGAASVAADMADKYPGKFAEGTDGRLYPGWGSGYAYSFGRDGYADTNYLDFTFAATAEVYLGFAIKPANNYGSAALLAFRNGSENRTHTVINLYDNISLCVNSANVQRAAAGSVLRRNRWQYVEVYYKCGDADGRVQVKVNGITVLNFTGDTRDLGTTAAIDTIRLSSTDGFDNTAALNTLFDDIYVLDASGTEHNTFLGPIKIEGILPDSAGDSSAWTPSAGSNYACVDDNPENQDTDYVESAATGDKDLYNFGALSVLSGTLKAVQVNAKARVTDATIKTLKHKCKSGSSEGDGTAIPVSDTTYGVERHIFTQDPSTGAAWTATNVNSAQFGIEEG